MTPERWERVKTLYELARARPHRERSSFLERECKGDTDLQLEVESLLDQPAGTAEFLGFVGAPARTVRDAPASDAAPLLVGRRLGSFEVRSLLGRGGMGEVYLAHDHKLGRDVAIKVLPHALTSDPARVASLEREARVVAALNHPHIAAIHGLEESAGVRGLVLELVEGQTLAQKLSETAGAAAPGLRLKDALNIARQIADALEAAHDKGITHRDLKPGNIKVTPDGVVKLLDFGIAKVVSGDDASLAFTQSQTASAATRPGLIAGTVGYMSPEQARGKAVDKRTDIWAFGCVLFEMLSGRMAFDGATVTDTIAAILERDPDWSTLPPDTPRAVRRLIQRCLEKDPKQRLRDIADVRVEIEHIIQSPGEDLDADLAAHQSRTWRRRAQMAFGFGAAALAAAAGLAAVWWLRDDPAAADARVVRMTIDLPKDQEIGPEFNSKVALSADGTLLAFTPLPGPVYIRRLNGLENQPLEITAAPGFRGAPLFSPDGASIAFIEGNSSFSASRPFLKASIAGGAPTKLVEYDSFHRGDWGADGWIYWTSTYPGGIVRIRESGGAIETVTDLDPRSSERSHRFAHLLPGGRALLFTAAFEGISSYNDARIELWDMATRRRKTLIEGGTSAVYSPSGHIVYARGGKLFAAAFDLSRQEVTGPAFQVLDGVMMSGNTGAAHFSMSARGDLAYVPGASDGANRTLVWVDRSGKADPLPLPPASYLYPRIAPDGHAFAVEIEGPNHDFYFYDFARTVLSKVTTDGMSHDPVWSADGKEVAFRSWQAGGMTLWRMPADRSAPATRLDPSGTRQSPVSFSPDGRFLTFDQKDPRTRDDVMVLPLDGRQPALPVAQTRFGEGSGKFSPDGRFIAFSSTESGRPEIYVQAFPGPGLKLQVSNNGGTDPVWRRQGGELYYRNDDKMMAVTVTTSPAFRAEAPRLLWESPYSHGTGSSCGMPGVASASYDVSADGQRFLMVREDYPAGATQIVVVLNWAEEVKARERAARQTAGAR
ncbi:MAG TPA: protein kinase [Vicinamibacterales bacterium]|nr:protein kinase [Vicinamibacterales bacterium]